VGRNPFYNHILGNDLKETRAFQRAQLEIGLKALAEYTNNPGFYSVLKNFDVSWDNTDRYINEFKQVTEAWQNFMEGVNI